MDSFPLKVGAITRLQYLFVQLCPVISFLPNFWYIGYSAVGEAHMVEKAIDVMRELRDEVNETVLLGTLVGNRGVILEQVLSTQPLKVMVDPGHNFALHTAAPAKAILAYMSPEDQNKIIDSITYTRFNENTIITKRQFIKNLKEAREKGYATDLAEEIINHNQQSIGVQYFLFRNALCPPG